MIAISHRSACIEFICTIVGYRGKMLVQNLFSQKKVNIALLAENRKPKQKLCFFTTQTNFFPHASLDV